MSARNVKSSDAIICTTWSIFIKHFQPVTSYFLPAFLFCFQFFQNFQIIDSLLIFFVHRISTGYADTGGVALFLDRRRCRRTVVAMVLSCTAHYFSTDGAAGVLWWRWVSALQRTISRQTALQACCSGFRSQTLARQPDKLEQIKSGFDRYFYKARLSRRKD